MAQPKMAKCQQCNKECWAVYTVTINNKMNLICNDCKWIKENVCPTCGMCITNRWDNHKIYKECEKELANKKAIDNLTERGFVDYVPKYKLANQ